MQTFSILGCGWLGLELALNLKEIYNVKVSIRDKKKESELINKGLVPYLLNEKDYSFLDNLLDTDYLFINFPPSKFDNYILFLAKIYSHQKINTIKKIFFISSTSIYPDEDMILTEELLIKNSNSKIIYDAEKIVNKHSDITFRCSGLMGGSRIAGKYFAGKALDSGNIKVNYVHRDDVIKATLFSIENDVSGIFNLCVPNHPSRKEVYLSNAIKYNFEKPIFRNNKNYKNRIVDGSKIERLGFRYKYQNPKEF